MKVPLCFVKSSVECFIEVFARREVELLQYVHTDGTYLCLILHSGNPFLKCFEKIVPVTDELLVGAYIIGIQPFIDFDLGFGRLRTFMHLQEIPEAVCFRRSVPEGRVCRCQAGMRGCCIDPARLRMDRHRRFRSS